ncbi:MAG: hypothetical protein ACI9F9_001845, partial [Candidatus Paceibacteria bacterium]
MSLQFLPNRQVLQIPEGHPPVLLVVIDTEEEFDWSKPFDRGNTSVGAMEHIGKAQEVFDDFGIRPTYVIDHPVASNPQGFEPLKEFAQSGRAVIGAHLHPWVSPPHRESVDSYHSYPGNLEPELEEEKLRRLTDTIERNIGIRPSAYKAGRYGFGPNTAEILRRLNYRVDLSPAAAFDLTADGGPDWSETRSEPYSFGPDGELLGLPTTGAFVGWLSRFAPALYRRSQSPPWSHFRTPGILSRLGALERLMLSPEGYTLEHQKRLTRALLTDGPKVLTFAFHSPS